MKVQLIRVAGVFLLVGLLFTHLAIAQEGDNDPDNFVTVTDPSLTGESGFLSLFSADSLPQGNWSVAIWHWNWDRETSDLDVTDIQFSFAYGLTDDFEIAASVIGWRQTDTDYFNTGNIDRVEGGVDFRHPAMPFPVGPINEGFGDVRIGAKYTFIHDTANSPGFAVAGHVKLGTADEEEGLGSGEMDFGVDAILSKRFNKALHVTANAGIIVRQTPDVLDDLGISLGNEFTYGVGARIFMGGGWRIIAEATGGSFFDDEGLDELSSDFELRGGLEKRFANGARIAGGYSREMMFDDPNEDENGAFFTLSYTTDRVFKISGTVTNCKSEPMAGVNINVSEIDRTVKTSADGTYNLEVRTGYSGLVTPSADGWFFLPEPREYNNVREDYLEQNYIAWPEQVKVSGHIMMDGKGVADISVRHSNGQSTTTDSNGYYEFTVRGRTDGTITAEDECYDIMPSDGSYEALCEPVTIDFNAKLTEFTKTGVVQDANGNPIPGVTIDYGSGKTITDAEGKYSFKVTCEWDGTITPSHSKYIFDPPVLKVDDIKGDAKISVTVYGYDMTVYFAFDRYNMFREDVEETSKQTLTKVAEYMLNVDKDTKVALHGHTCYIQLKCENDALSKARALFIAQWLVEQGVDPSRITYDYYGETRPAYDNSQEITRRNNRRVEIEFVDSIGEGKNLTEEITYEAWKELCRKSR